MTQTEAVRAVSEVISQLVRGWAEGDGPAYAMPFAEDGWFIAFDGTLLRGRTEIGAFHQRAFNAHLSSTLLHLDIEEVRVLDATLIVALTRGGISRNGESQGELIGASVQTFVMRELGKRLVIETFQNTRDRPIRSPESANVWSEFDLAWNRLG